MRSKLGDLPTVKLRKDELARYAREADERAVQAEAASARVTHRPEPLPGPEIEVSVELAEMADLGDAAVHAVDLGATPPPSFDGVGEGSDHASSDVRVAIHDGPPMSSVPCVVASKEDLSWFELEETSHVVLAMIDGESTVESIVSMLTIPRAHSLAILRELGSHGVIEFH